ncbi:hypothetical protein [Bacillus cereus group sp. BfR-BA-01310]|uniref:DUF7832 domain-containing protein n=1 Tax=Bacillus cereus group sp. BfR-BA-01310 TaxID=2920287 RepID=UPI0035AB8580
MGVVQDKAKYYFDDLPEDLPIEQAYVHTGMFLGWIIENNLFSKEFEEKYKDDINRFKLRQITGTQIYMKWGGVFADDMLNDGGNQFATYYFNTDNRWKYMNDYMDVFVDAGETLYHVQDTWGNYFELKEEIDYSYMFWKNNIQKL